MSVRWPQTQCSTGIRSSIAHFSEPSHEEHPTTTSSNYRTTETPDALEEFVDHPGPRYGMDTGAVMSLLKRQRHSAPNAILMVLRATLSYRLKLFLDHRAMRVYDWSLFCNGLLFVRMPFEQLQSRCQEFERRVHRRRHPKSTKSIVEVLRRWRNYGMPPSTF